MKPWQIIIPMSGFGERFRRAGYTVPKPLIDVLGKPVIGHVLDMFPGEKQVFFICNLEHLNEPAFALRETLSRLCPDGAVIGIMPHKLGPVYAVSKAFDAFDPTAPTIVNYCDFTCLWDWKEFQAYVKQTACVGAVMGYTGFHPHMLGSTNYAYVRNDGDRVLSIQEKQPYTDNPMAEYASSGTYYFSSGDIMRKAFEETVAREDLLVKGEYYVSLSYIPLLEQGADIRVFPVERFMQWGTPEDLEEFLYHAGLHCALRSAPENADPLPVSGTVVIPMAGMGSRFSVAGYALPKPLIPVDGEPMSLRATRDLPALERQIFLVRADMPGLEDIRALLVTAMPRCAIFVLPGPTEGQAITCLEAMKAVPPGSMVTIGACDNGYLYDQGALMRLLADENVDFIIWGIRGFPGAARRPNMYGWIDADENGEVRGVSVKKAFSDPRNDPIVTGAFIFKRKEDFVLSAERMIARSGRVNNEFYVDECCNDALALGLKGKMFPVNAYICWGTPEELRTYEYWRDVFARWNA